MTLNIEPQPNTIMGWDLGGILGGAGWNYIINVNNLLPVGRTVAWLFLNLIPECWYSSPRSGRNLCPLPPNLDSGTAWPMEFDRKGSVLVSGPGFNEWTVFFSFLLGHLRSQPSCHTVRKPKPHCGETHMEGSWQAALLGMEVSCLERVPQVSQPRQVA